MKITFLGNGLVWDSAKNKVLCKFIEGKYTTSDTREIDILKNYPTDPVDALKKEKKKSVKHENNNSGKG